jgi:hypothetical protein
MRSQLRYGEPSQGSNGRAADRLLGLGDGTPPNSEACGVQVKSPTYDSSKMSLELPLDVWLHLLKFKHLMNDSVGLSITCKALREILLPTLYCNISFGKTPLPYCGIKDIEAFLSRVRDRTESLRRSPHLCRHVQVVIIHDWTTFRYMSKATSEGQKRSIFASLAYEGVITLLPQLPHLQRVVLSKSTINPSLHSCILFHSHLTDISVSMCEIHEVIANLFGSSDSAPIQRLAIDDWDASTTHSQLYLSRII